MTGQELKAIRTQAGLSMSALAKKLGTAISTISMAEAGKRALSEPLSRLVLYVTGNAPRASKRLQRPLVGVGVMVVKDGKVLLGKRKGAHGAGEFSFPGGHLEKNESFEEACKREVQEETGIVIGNLAPLQFENHIFEKEGLHYVTLFFTADYVSGDVVNKEPEKCEGWDWYSPDALPSPLFASVGKVMKGVQYDRS